MRMFLICSLSFANLLATAQGCADALNNYMCSGTPQPVDTMVTNPVNTSCFNATETFYYSFHTNSIAQVSSVEIVINNYDCDDIIGNDSIQVLVAPLLANTDPCDPTNLVNPQCFADSASNFTIDLANLADNQDYIVIVGSNHDVVNYGPCAYDINISGSAVEIVAGVSSGQILISLGESVELNVAGADTTASINWAPAQFLDDPTSTNPNATPDGTTTFQVTGTVGDCTLSDLISITVSDPVIIYNTFTPNGDGINDSFRIKYIERFPNCQIEIFDRWGQSIFKSVGYAQPWDGTYKGREIPTGPYYYVIELNSLEVTIPPITGVVSIVH
ncbi:MAG: gliding motility-associated C-terminal domain-containing protein [Flavobacteriales bacterium]|nr:gliding motility-associated C-terminal domain-containing protein [Flavobacteriales bacterium]